MRFATALAAERGAETGVDAGVVHLMDSRPIVACATLVALTFVLVRAQLPFTMPSVHPSEPRSQSDRQVPPLRFGDARLPTDVRLRYAEQGDSAGHTVILLHGYTDSWFSFSRVLPLLPASYHVYALDLRAHGDSDRPAGGYTMRDLATDVVSFMDVKGLGRTTVVGHSMGSFVAQQVALAAPERVARLVLVGSATTPRNIIGILELQRTVDSLMDPVPADFARAFQMSTVYRPLPDDFMNRMVAGSLKLPARVWRALMAGLLATDRSDRLGDSRIPTLILWGERDAYFPRSEQDALVAMLPTAALKVYSETGHAPHWEQPEEFAGDLEEFITRTEAR